MQKKLTITVDQRVYEGLHSVIGRKRISQFIEAFVQPYLVGKDLELAYQQMAKEEARESEALEWAEAIIGDVTSSLLMCYQPLTHVGCYPRRLLAVEQAAAQKLQALP
jgi:hypothetical protein